MYVSHTHALPHTHEYEYLEKAYIHITNIVQFMSIKCISAYIHTYMHTYIHAKQAQYSKVLSTPTYEHDSLENIPPIDISWVDDMFGFFGKATSGIGLPSTLSMSQVRAYIPYVCI